MRVVFVQPNTDARRSADAVQPLAFAVLAGLTPPEVDLAFFDERVEALPASFEADLVALSVQTFTARRAYEIADRCRARGQRVVLGGYHPTFLPDEAAAHADAVVVGPAEPVWGQLLADAASGQLRRRYQGQSPRSLAGVRYPRDLFTGKRHIPVHPVEFGRGCRYACDFCSVSAFHDRRFVTRPVSETLREIAAQPGRALAIIDDNFYADRARARELVGRMRALRKAWGCQISLDVAKDTRMLDAMARSGCAVVLLGFESLSAANLEAMDKRGRAPEDDYALAIARIRERGIMIYGSFIFGYDHDTADVFERTLDFALDNKLALANFNTLTPMPGTALYRRLRAEGRLLEPHWWLDPRYQYGEVMFRPRHMEADTLARKCLEVRDAFFSARGILRRLTDPAANLRQAMHLGLFLGGNLIARREMRRKMEHLR